MTLTETNSVNASLEVKLAEVGKQQDVSENFVQKVDGILNRAFDELDLLSASLMSRAETLSGLRSGESGPSGSAKSFPSVSSGASASAKSLRPSLEKIRH